MSAGGAAGCCAGLGSGLAQTAVRQIESSGRWHVCNPFSFAAELVRSFTLHCRVRPTTCNPGLPVGRQGASPSEEVLWTYPPEELPPQGLPYEVPASLPSRSGPRPPLALAAAGGSRDAVAVLLRLGAQADAAVLRHVGKHARW